MLLKDKVALITGGAGPNGLGFATASLMAAHGAKVVIMDLARAEPARPPPRRWATTTWAWSPTSRKASCEAAVAAVLEAFGRIDVLVNNAGITQPRKTRGHHGSRLRRACSTSACAACCSCRKRSFPPCSNRRADRSSASPRCRRSAAAASSAARITRPPRPACWAWPARWRANSDRQHPRQLRSRPGLIATDISKGKLTDEQKEDIAQTIPLPAGRGRRRGRRLRVPCQRPVAYCTGITLDVNGGMLIH